MRFAAALLATLLCAGAAGADKLLFSGEHGIRFTPNFGIPAEVTAAGTGVATANGGTSGSSALSTLQLTEDFTQITTAIPITAPGLATKIPEIRLTGVRIDPQVQGGIFAPILAAVQAGSPLNTSQRTMPAAGQVRLCQVVGCGTAISQVLSQTSMGAAIGIGVGGSFTIGGTNPTHFTVIGQPWTVNTAAVSYRTTNGGTATLTGMGFVQGPASMTGTTLDPTANPMSGTVQLVTAVQIHAQGIPGPHDLSGQIIRLTLHFQPEPGRLFLLGSGAAALALLAVRRRRSA